MNRRTKLIVINTSIAAGLILMAFQGVGVTILLIAGALLLVVANGAAIISDR